MTGRLPRGPQRRWRDARVMGIGYLTFAAAISAGISIASVPLVTGLYSPISYGAFALVLAASATLSVVVTGRYEILCVVAAHDSAGEVEARTGLRLSVIIAVVICAGAWLVCGIVVLLWGPGMASEDEAAWFLTPPLVLLAALMSIQSVADTRHERYGLLAWLMIMRSLILAGGQIILGFFSPTTLSLVTALALSYAPSAVRLGAVVWRDRGLAVLPYRRVAHVHRRYPQYQVPAALANALSTNVMVFALGAAYGIASVALYSVATRLTSFPSSIVGGPVNTVYLREAARGSSEPVRSRRLYRQVNLTLGLVGLAVFAALLLVLPLVMLLLGPEWQQARGMIVATIPMGMALLITAPANSALVAFGRQAALLIWRVVLIAVPTGVILLGPAVGLGDTAAVASAGLSMLAGTGAFVLWSARVVSQASRQPVVRPTEKTPN